MEIRNIIAALKDGTFLQKCIAHFGIYRVQNENTLQFVEEDRIYRKLEKKYASAIARGVENPGERKHSDYIWICWFQGEDAAPELIRACIRSARKYMPGKKIVILTEETIPQYVHFPDCIWEKRKKGLISHAHFSDLLRVSLLCDYGGMWCDATLLFTDTPPKLMTDDPFFVFRVLDLKRVGEPSLLCSSWFMSAWSNSKVLLLTRDLLYRYWETENTLCHYFLYHCFLSMAMRRYPEEMKAMPFYNNSSPHVLQFELGDQFDPERWEQIKKMSPLHKLNHHNDYSASGDSFYRHVVESRD